MCSLPEGFMKKEVNKLLKSLGKSLGLKNLILDDNNHCILLFDEKIVLNLELKEETERLVVYAYVGEVPLEDRENVFECLLEANCFWKETGGATIGIDKQSQTIVLAYSVDLPLKKPEAFEENLASFVEVVETWVDRLEKMAQAAAEVLGDDE